MRLGDQTIGSPSLYSTRPRLWSDQDITVASSYLVNASKMHQLKELSVQLQQALESRIVIEQAKGITARQNGITINAAYKRIRRHARNNNASLRKVAEAIVAVGLRV
jgi:AmiR/NasT family two-component response regulator